MNSSPLVLGTLATLGYTEPDALARVEAFVARPRAYLIDIRLAPYSAHAPTWNKPALASRYGRCYAHLRGLGNVHYQDRRQGIRLLDPEPHLEALAEGLRRGVSYLLLCACRDAQRCHRSLVADLLRARLLGAADQRLPISAEPEPVVIVAVSLWDQDAATSDTPVSIHAPVERRPR